MDRTQTSQSSDQSRSSSSPIVLSIECLKGSSKAEEWTGDMLQTGDIVEELRIGGGSVTIRPPFKNGKIGVQKILHSSFKSKDTSIVVRVRRGPAEFSELQACIVPCSDSFGKNKQYMLRSIDDPNYAVGFCDRSESDCLHLIGSSDFSESPFDFSSAPKSAVLLVTYTRAAPPRTCEAAVTRPYFSLQLQLLYLAAVSCIYIRIETNRCSLKTL
ncbi:hypothetical protein CDL15_Pgr025397 [Punica granatum]|uniref:Uncharacterized protein n=1 Tax=Punica granatum TaxID=22663 RepID=A0A218WA33_PUNGR|nr:hypothetical protein CDL15_Pgr025397 [Punica granatum]